MSHASRVDAKRVLGRSPEQLELRELAVLAGQVVALEIYTPAALPLRKIAALGETAEDCMAQLTARGLDPRNFEYAVLKQPC
jgi:hypothetical protein